MPEADPACPDAESLIPQFPPLFLLLRIPSLAHRIAKSDPQVQQTKPGDQAAHCAIGGNARERWVLGKNRILIPEHSRPGNIANSNSDVHPEQHPDKQFGALKPAWDSLMGLQRSHRASRARLRGNDRNRSQNRRRRAHRTHRQQWRCGFRQLGHALGSHRVPGRSRSLSELF